jgi:hypothetical protein
MCDSDKSKIKWAPLEGNPEVYSVIFYKRLILISNRFLIK